MVLFLALGKGVIAPRKRRHWSLFPPVELLIYVLARAALMIVQTFPLSAAPRLGRRLGRALRMGSKKRTHIAVGNLSGARETLAPFPSAEILAKAYDSLGQGRVELLMTPRLLQSHRLGGARKRR